jgi:hypothetical protein
MAGGIFATGLFRFYSAGFFKSRFITKKGWIKVVLTPLPVPFCGEYAPVA